MKTTNVNWWFSFDSFAPAPAESVKITWFS